MRVHEKYVIEIEEIICGYGNLFDREDVLGVIPPCARIKGFNTLFFDQHDLDKLTPLEQELEWIKSEDLKKVYDDGLRDAWNAAKKLFGEWSDNEIQRTFPIEWNRGGFRALMELDPAFVVGAIQERESQQHPICMSAMRLHLGRLVTKL